MATVLEEIYNTDKYICAFIENTPNMDRGLISQAIIAVLRNFVEHIALYEYSIDKKETLENKWENIHNKGVPYLSCLGHLKFLKEFHEYLSISVSHYTPSQDNSERLMLKYYEYLFRIRKYLEEKRNIRVLNNLEKFPLNQDLGLSEYYKKISIAINRVKSPIKKEYNSFYILKKRPFFVNKRELYFEMTLSIADDYSSKFDRIIVYTKEDIPYNYVIKTSFIYEFIWIFDMQIPITIIDDWEVAIRPCELNNYCKFFGLGNNIQKGYVEYKGLMAFIKESGFTLVDLVKMPDEPYNNIKREILKGNKKEHFFPAVDATRELYKDNAHGINILLYLLNNLSNIVLKKQFKPKKEPLLSNLFLNIKCKPFDELPFNTALINHIPKYSDLIASIGIKGHEDELLARHIANNTELEGVLYTNIKDLAISESKLDKLISSYNDKLYSGHRITRKIVKDKGHLFINGYEQDTVSIITKLIELSKNGISGYENYAESWLQSSKSNVDDSNKILILKKMFVNSKVSFVYGSAGTGKSTLIDHISNLFANNKKVFLANTNPAVDNLRTKVKAPNSNYMTITKYLKGNMNHCSDILVIDECSTVSNSNMLDILNKSEFKLLILVGDIHQIESISFGNWFKLCRYFIKKDAIFELEKPFRAKEKKLLNLWDSVRNIAGDIAEKLEKAECCLKIDKSLFLKLEEKEILLCLNYDGLYGINNLNKILQMNNPNPAVRIGVLDYKVGDQILFKENKRFYPVLYNNLKGKIVKIEENEKYYYFEIEVEKAITEMDIGILPIKIIDSSTLEKTTIGINVYKFKGDSDGEDREEETIVPFQIAYAISIHKSQGLEYDSVKIVVTKEVDELITHNIFYTAITRAREKLKIYWSPESQKKILESFKRTNDKDHYILANKFDLEINTN